MMERYRDVTPTLMAVSLLAGTLSCSLPESSRSGDEEQPPRMQKVEWGQVGESPVFLYTLTNRQGLKARITNYGTILTEMHVPDRQGRMADITLGFDKLEDYLPRHPYFGCICGRVVNRISGARFTLDGREYSLTKNYGEHHLHGGDQGFDRKVWAVAGESESDNGASVKMTYTSPDGEEGYPGNLTTSVTYRLGDDNSLRFEMEAETDAPTIVNLAHHAYWNLAGHDAAGVLGHELQLNAPSYTVSDGLGVPTGEIRPVEGTRFDFTKPKTLGAEIGKIPADAKDQREGYDVNFVLDGSPGQLRRAARVREPVSGRTLEVHTTAPGVQLYTGNYLDGTFQGKGGHGLPKADRILSGDPALPRFHHQGGPTGLALHHPSAGSDLPSYRGVHIRTGVSGRSLGTLSDPGPGGLTRAEPGCGLPGKTTCRYESSLFETRALRGPGIHASLVPGARMAGQPDRALSG